MTGFQASPHRFRFIEPTFCAGLFDDPLLYIFVRPLGYGLLFDCGQLHHLAKRVLRSIRAIFITHAHMDHSMGLDTFIRHNHVSPRTIELFGPPGIIERFHAKLRGYDWNLAEPGWCTFEVHEIAAETITTCVFRGADGFAREQAGKAAREDRTIYRNAFVRVEAELCDHKIPALMFRLVERERFSIDETKLRDLGLVKGDWLRALKKYYYGVPPQNGYLKIPVLRGEEIEEMMVDDPGALAASVVRNEPPASIGYITDAAWSEDFLATIARFLPEVSLLVCESSFLAEDAAKARMSCHLCTRDLNVILHRLKPRYFLPMHLSKTYISRRNPLYDEFDPPPGVTLIRIPERITPRPLLPGELVPLKRILHDDA